MMTPDLRPSRRVAALVTAAVLATLVFAAPAFAASVGVPSGASVIAEATPVACPSPTPTPVPTASPTPAPTLAPGETAVPTTTPNPTPALILCGAPGPGSAHFDPITGLLAWLFTPIFQALVIALAGFYTLTGDIGIAIVLLTILLRVVLIRPYRTQIVSQRRMQMVQPELRAIQQRYKGDRNKISQEQMRLYRERGVSPAAGCLPAILQFGLLVPMYQVIREGLSAASVDPMLTVFGQKLFNVPCQDPGNAFVACISPTVHWLGGLNAAQPEVLFWFVRNPDLGLSILALVSAALQLIQTRMVTPQTNDPQQRAQQRTFLFLPLISLVYGGFLPAGLFLYWIASTLFAIGQQYLMVGWGSLFPLFGWTPPFAVDHTPRFPIALAAAGATGGGSSGAANIASAPPRAGGALDRAAGTVRPSKQRGRTSRRGRRR
jgi:YidC/Oxa1 family membrane protein insertase